MTQTLKKENLEDKFEEYSQVVYKNQRLLLEIDKFAKSLGFKIFRLDCEFETDCGTQILRIVGCVYTHQYYDMI